MVTIQFGPFDVLAVVGAVTGVIALIWQVATWRRGSHRVVVKTANSFPIGGLVETEHLVAITAHNVGAMAVDIVAYGITAANGGNLNDFRRSQPNGPLPHRLEPGASVDYYMNADAIREYREESGFPFSRMKPWVRLGTGKTVMSRRSVPLRD